MLENVTQGMRSYLTPKRIQRITAGILEVLAIKTNLSWINPENVDELVKKALLMQRTGGEVRILNNLPWDTVPTIFQNQK